MRKGGTIGIDKTWPARFLLRLMELQVGDAYVNASTIIDHIRQIKTAEEQEKMRVASRCNDISIEELIPLVSKGMTEAELGEELLKIYLKTVPRDIPSSRSSHTAPMQQIRIMKPTIPREVMAMPSFWMWDAWLTDTVPI